MVESWRKIDSETVGDYRIFTLREDTSISPRTGKQHHFYVLEAGDWVNVIPVTPEGKVVMIRQYRHGREEVHLEIPGGMVDDGETPAASARRELLEETGYAPQSVIPIGVVTPNPAFLDNHCHTFLALGARRQQPPSFDGAEDIESEEVDLAKITDFIANGRISHALVVAAFYHLENYRRQHPGIIPHSE